MIWPWSKIAQLEEALRFERQRNTDWLWRFELRQNIALKAMREVAAANKGIRRLKDKLNRLKKEDS